MHYKIKNKPKSGRGKRTGRREPLPGCDISPWDMRSGVHNPPDPDEGGEAAGAGRGARGAEKQRVPHGSYVGSPGYRAMLEEAYLPPEEIAEEEPED